MIQGPTDLGRNSFKVSAGHGRQRGGCPNGCLKRRIPSSIEGFPTRTPLRRPAPAANRSCITICIRLKFMSNQPAFTEKISLLVNHMGATQWDHLGHDLSAEGTILMRQGISGRPRGIIFILTSQCKIRLLARAGRRVSTGETSRISFRMTAPAPELNPRSLRAAVRSERHRWLIGRWLLRGGLPPMFQGGNDAAHPRSTHGRVTPGRFLVSSSPTHASWERALETRQALRASGRPSSRPTPKLSI
jgi:hypothetical protein